jgi:hypothetical protein
VRDRSLLFRVESVHVIGILFGARG